MARLIDADALLKELRKSCKYHAENSRELSLLQRDINIVQEQPTAETDMSEYSDRLWKIAYERGKAEAVKRGEWIVWDEVIAGMYHTVSECSECGFTTDKMFREEMPYCPNCGARLDAERK